MFHKENGRLGAVSRLPHLSHLHKLGEPEIDTYYIEHIYIISLVLCYMSNWSFSMHRYIYCITGILHAESYKVLW